jgi:hypothetical protein
LWILAMALSSATTPIARLMTFRTIISYIGSITITSVTKTWSFLIMLRLVHNETLDVRAYHHSLHITCPLSWTKGIHDILNGIMCDYLLTSK